ncbi:putative inactive carboxylesterase 4 [Rhipicephalus sanguineus]|uniref:putative inactive carboxylesterase 4 n=1 Tax=Rhipicephalus sanguineus TaxID=34632 RepID=UPI0018961884|nr:putative inactive carboxylesterase 4 [Rhipicephalus sanguineus]
MPAVEGAEEFTIVRAPVGKVRGAIRSAPDGKNVYAFTGIRYAQPPTGQLRYRKPQPEEPWENSIRDATQRPPSCSQTSVYQRRHLIWVPYRKLAFATMHTVYMSASEEKNFVNPVVVVVGLTILSEDCLYLNVWTPTLNNTAMLLVMAWIHGGQFLDGSAAMHLDDGGNLAALGNVVVVTIGYRLQSFGFLYDGTEEAPGNQGLYDQLLALEWIQSNIGAFGGDPGEVTLFGWSAGGVVIGFFLSMSDASLPFKQAIVQSGPASIKFLAKNNTIALNDSRKFASIFGCANKSSQNDTPFNFVACMRNVNASLILAVEQNFKDSGIIFMPIFGDGLLKTDPEVATFTGHRDVLIGHVVNEGTVNLYANFPDVFSKILQPRQVDKSEMVYYLGALHKGLSLPEILGLRDL